MVSMCVWANLQGLHACPAQHTVFYQYGWQLLGYMHAPTRQDTAINASALHGNGRSAACSEDQDSKTKCNVRTLL